MRLITMRIFTWDAFNLITPDMLGHVLDNASHITMYAGQKMQDMWRCDIFVHREGTWISHSTKWHPRGSPGLWNQRQNFWITL